MWAELFRNRGNSGSKDGSVRNSVLIYGMNQIQITVAKDGVCVWLRRDWVLGRMVRCVYGGRSW